MVTLISLVLLPHGVVLGESLPSQNNSSTSFTVVGYLPEWRYEGANFETLCQHLTHLLLFSLEPTPNGDVAALDRLPNKDLMAEIQSSCDATTKILICFGGNGRSHGFSKMVQSKQARALFVKNIVKLCEQYGLNGVDYNWEYPGYEFGRGYQSQEEIAADYQGLALLVSETRNAFDRCSEENLNTITLAYYPDKAQEQLLMQFGISEHVD